MDLNNITAEPWQFIIDHAEKLPQGINVWYKGVPYPRRVYYDENRDLNFTLRVLEALGTVKKYLFALVYLKGVVIPRTLKIKKYEVFLIHLYKQFEWTLGDFYIKDEEYSVPVWEIGKLVENFLINLGLIGWLAKGYTRIIMMFLEFDCAYRYRAQDLLSLVEQIDRSNLEYILKVYNQREGHYFEDGARSRINQPIKLLRLLLLLPKFSRALKKAQEGVDFGKIRFDKNDRFHFSFWQGYDFESKTFEERFKPYEDLYKTIPFKKRDDPEKIANFMVGL